MLNKIIQYSLHNRLLVMIAAVALLIWGSITAHNMEVDVFPDLNAPTVVVMTEAQGMAPEEVERLVTFPVETAVSGVHRERHQPFYFFRCHPLSFGHHHYGRSIQVWKNIHFHVVGCNASPNQQGYCCNHYQQTVV